MALLPLYQQERCRSRGKGITPVCFPLGVRCRGQCEGRGPYWNPRQVQLSRPSRVAAGKHRPGRVIVDTEAEKPARIRRANEHKWLKWD